MNSNYTVDEIHKCIQEETNKKGTGLAVVFKNLKKYTKKFSRQEKNDYDMMYKNLTELKKKVNNDTDWKNRELFVEFFENALVGAFWRYRHSKKKTWSKLYNAVLLISTACVPLVSAGLVALFESGEGYLSGASTFEVSATTILGVLAVAYIEWKKMKNDKETWVRHSVCYARLNLLLNRLMLSEQKEEDYRYFVDGTYAILEQNLDQFAQNLSTNGLAERQEMKSPKD